MSVPRRLFPVLIALALAPAVALAHSVADEVSAGTTPPTPNSPTTHFVGDTLRGGINLSEAVALRLSLGLTYNAPSRRPGAHFTDSGGSIFTSALGVDWEMSEHFDASLDLDLSPKSTQSYDTSIKFTETPAAKAGQPPPPPTTVEIDSLMAATNGSRGAAVSFGYNTAGDSNFETAVDAGAAYTGYDTGQVLSRIEQGGKPATLQALRTECAKPKAPRLTCRALAPALKGEAAALNQFQLRATWTGTLFADTDLTLSGSYYLYDKDPTQVGYFTKLVLGRKTSNGAGIPIAPVLYSVRPEVSHRFGDLMVDLWYNYNLYFGTEGYGHSVGLKIQYKLNSHFKIWASGTWQSDLQPADPSTPGTTPAATVSLSGMAGLKYSW